MDRQAPENPSERATPVRDEFMTAKRNSASDEMRKLVLSLEQTPIHKREPVRFLFMGSTILSLLNKERNSGERLLSSSANGVDLAIATA